MIKTSGSGEVNVVSSVTSVGGGRASSGVRIVDHVVVEQGRGVDHLRDLREPPLRGKRVHARHHRGARGDRGARGQVERARVVIGCGGHEQHHGRTHFLSAVAPALEEIPFIYYYYYYGVDSLKL